MQAVLLAAGKGERLEPFTATKPKPVLPFANKSLIKFLVEFISGLGIKDIIIIVGYRADLIKDTLKEKLRIRYVNQKNLLGPIHGLLEAKGLLNDDFLLLCADSFIRPEMIRNVMMHKNESNCLLCTGVCLRPLYHSKAVSDNHGNLVRVEKIKGERQFEAKTVIAGLGLLKKNMINKTEEFVRQAKRDEWTNFFAWLSEREKVKVIGSDFKFIDMDYPWEIWDGVAKEYLFEKTGNLIAKDVKIAKGVSLEGNVVIEPQVLIEHGSTIKNSWIGGGTVILANSYITHAFIGRECKIGPQSFVAGTVGDNSKIGYATEYSAHALGKVRFYHQCHVSGVWGNNSGATPYCSTTEGRVAGDRKTKQEIVKVKIKGKLVSSGLDGLGPFIGENSSLLTGAKIMPGKKIGPDSSIGPNVVVYHDVPANQQLILRQQLEVRPYLRDRGCKVNQGKGRREKI